MPFGIGAWEIALAAIVALLVFGPSRLPEMGRSLGRGMREFKQSITGSGARDDHEATGATVASEWEEPPSLGHRSRKRSGEEEDATLV